MIVILLAGLVLGILGFLAAFYLPFAVGGVVAAVAGVFALLGALMLRGAKDSHGPAAVGGGLAGIGLLGGGAPFFIGTLLGLLFH